MNPFIVNSEFQLKVIEVYTRKYESNSGYNIVERTTKSLVEEQQKVSIYKIGNSEQFTSFLFEMLNSSARDLYLYIIANLGKNLDTITLNHRVVSEKIGISEKTYYNAINTLKENYVITPYKKSVFWINPYFFFRGDRITYYKKECPDCINIVSKVTSGEKLTEEVNK